jgi:DNA-binding MarR family transcriptional regulator
MSNGSKIRLVRDALRRFNRWAGVLKSDPYGLQLSLSQGSALVDIDRYGPLRPGTLATMLNLEKSSISRLVQTLIKKRLVVLSNHTEDARAKLLTLTSKGKEAVRVINRLADSSIEQAFQSLSMSEQDQLVSAFTRFADVVEGAQKNFSFGSKEERL